MRLKLTQHLFFFLIAFLTSCCCGHRAAYYPLPTDALEDAITDANRSPLINTQECLPERWWLIFNDPQLSEFIEITLCRNPTVEIAYANILKAIYISQQVRAALLPNIIWGGDVSRQKFSETGLIPFNTNPGPGFTPFAAPPNSGIPVYFTQYETELIGTFDFDIWQKNRNHWIAALDQVQARIADEAFIRLQMAINVARVYFKLQVDYKRQKIVQALVENRKELLSYIERRIKANLDNALSINYSLANLVSSEEALLRIQADIVANENQLRAFLAGDFDELICNTAILESALPKVALPCDLPLHLIARRPDIISNLWLIESEDREIEVAKAEFYPDFNITALLGLQTIHLPKLFEGKSSFYNVDPAFSLPLFDGGRLCANLQESEIDYDLAVYRYNESVINAVKEVLDAIALLQNADKQLQQFKQATQVQENLFQLTQMRMQGHLSSKYESLISQGNLYVALDQEIVTLGQTIQRMLDLIKAIGGGYGECEI